MPDGTNNRTNDHAASPQAAPTKAMHGAVSDEARAKEVLAREIEAEGIADAHAVRRQAIWRDGPGHTKRLEDAAIRAMLAYASEVSTDRVAASPEQSAPEEVERETLERYADRIVGKCRRYMMDRLDDDVIGRLGESHLIFGKACAMEAVQTAMREVGEGIAAARNGSCPVAGASITAEDTLIGVISRLTHSGDDGWVPSDEHDAQDALDALIARARTIRSTTQTGEAAGEGWISIANAKPRRRYIGAFESPTSGWILTGTGSVRNGTFWNHLGEWRAVDRVFAIPPCDGPLNTALASAPKQTDERLREAGHE